MTEQLGRRCALVLLVALTLALLVGMLAWGPVALDTGVHRYADRRTLLGVPHAIDVLVNLPVALIGLWGWRATRSSRWPSELSVPWQAFHLCVAAGSVLAALHHASPGQAGYVVAQLAMTSAFVLLTVGALAERVSLRFGSRRGLHAAAALIAVAFAIVVSGAALGAATDMRPFILLQAVPVLLIPAGALSLPGHHTRTADWLAMLTLYAAAKVFDLADAPIHRWTGWLSGHALMHLSLGGVAAWLGYCATRARAEPVSADVRRRKASLTTVS